jgi:hypothetical protein
MRVNRVSRERRPPTGPTQTFVIYDKKTGAIRGFHHIIGASPGGDKMLTAEKRRRASDAVASAVMKRTASMSSVSPATLSVLELKGPMPRVAKPMRVDLAKRRLVPALPAAGIKLSKLIRPSRRVTR